jgi:hypothetical protein
MCGEQNAAYFYSRIKNDKVVFISHHFEKEPALEDMFPEVLAVLEGIRQNVLINEE